MAGSFIDGLKKILIKEKNYQVESEGPLKLEEEYQGNKKRYKITLKNVPQGSLLIKTDKFPDPKKILQEGFRKRADYVLITEKRIIFIELKSGKLKKKEVTDQFSGAKSVTDYYIAIVKYFLNLSCPITIDSTDQNCFLVIHKTRKEKTPIENRLKKSDDSFQKIYCKKTLYYNELLT